MTQKCCLNCAYLCWEDRQKNLRVWSAYQRNEHKPAVRINKPKCFHQQWVARVAQTEEELLVEIKGSRGRRVWDLNVHVLTTSGSTKDLRIFSCVFHSTFNGNDSKPVSRVWQEHRQRIQDARDRRRFIITALIGGVTAAAVIASAIFHWLEWVGGTP